MRNAILVLTLLVTFSPVVHAASPGQHQLAGYRHQEMIKARNEVEAYANRFDSLHMAIGALLEECKTAVTLLQAQSLIIIEGHTVTDADFDKIDACIQQNWDGALSRYRDFQADHSAVSDYARPDINTYMETVQQGFDQIPPQQEEDGTMEDMATYDARFQQMQNVLNETADMVSERIRMMPL
jgi:hypothetical protein